MNVAASTIFKLILASRLVLSVTHTSSSSETKAIPCGNSITDLAPCYYSGDYCSFIDNFDNPLRGIDWSIYSGDPKGYDFIVESGSPTVNAGILTMPLKNSGVANQATGTIISTTRLLNYGSFEARFKSVGQSSIVTTFIGISNVLDEIDFEIVPKDVSNANQAQSNWYYRGNAIYNVNFQDVHLPNNTFDNFHVYRVDWTTDSMVWSVDGKIFQTQTRAALGVNASSYPSTPMRISFGVWQAQDNEWAGPSSVNFAANPPQNLAVQFDYVKVIGMDCGGGSINANPPASSGFNYANKPLVVYTPAVIVGGKGGSSAIGGNDGFVIARKSSSQVLTPSQLVFGVLFGLVVPFYLFHI